MKNARLTICLVVVCVMAVVNIASAEIIRGIGMDFVSIGNAGNGTDPATGSLYGAVGYNYRIGKYEVTNAQWNAFVAVVGAPTGNPSEAYDESAFHTGAEQPTTGVSWYETLQFCNYLTSGDKSKGVYQFSGNNANPCDFLGIDRAAAQVTYGTIYFLPTEDEWYKAAYYKPDRSGYSLYANGTNIAPIAGVDAYYLHCGGQPWNIGTGTMEQNGTFDMMGNVWELMQTTPIGTIRGGSYGSDDVRGDLRSSYRYWENSPYNDEPDLGFRVASIPEPAIEALVDINPDSLNKNSKGQWVTVYITLPEGYDVSKINVSTIAITSLVGTSCQPQYNQAVDLSFIPQVGDRDEDGIPDLTVKFNRQELIANLCLDDVAITVEGKLFTGKHFKGTDRIRVIDRGK